MLFTSQRRLNQSDKNDGEVEAKNILVDLLTTFGIAVVAVAPAFPI